VIPLLGTVEATLSPLPRRLRAPGRWAFSADLLFFVLMWAQRTIRLAPRPRGFHLVSAEVLDSLPELEEVSVGILHLLIQHTSASLALSENASPQVRDDFESWFDRAVPEGAPYWTHTLEGEDDMPAHVKAALLGPALTLPLSAGRPALGTWQGIYLCEHRDHGGSRSLIATISGEPLRG
jgi:secondary thiamine-phosphate synthase enzyme